MIFDPVTLALLVEEVIPEVQARRAASTPVQHDEHCVHCGQPIFWEDGVGEWVVNDGGCDSSESGTHEPF